jgi:hypothetical protein
MAGEQLYGPFELIGVPGIKLFVGKVTRTIRSNDAEPPA